MTEKAHGLFCKAVPRPLRGISWHSKEHFVVEAKRVFLVLFRGFRYPGLWCEVGQEFGDDLYSVLGKGYRQASLPKLRPYYLPNISSTPYPIHFTNSGFDFGGPHPHLPPGPTGCRECEKKIFKPLL